MTEKPTGPACGNNPNYPLTEGDRAVVEAVRTELAQRAERRDRYAAAIWERQNPGRRYADCEHSWRADPEEDALAVMTVADAEQADLRTQLARVRAVADAIDTEMRTEPDTLRAAMQQEAVVRIRAALDGHPLHGEQQGAAPSAPASPAPLAARLPLVQGRCPACGTAGLFLGDGGYVTCSVRECPEPDAASTVLERQAAAAQPPADRDLRGRIAQALVRYDWNAGLSGRDTPSEHHYGEADAVLAALPAPADRAAVLREAADAIEGITFAPDPVRPTFVAACLAIHLRRMADEAQQATPSVADADDPTQLRWGLGDVLYGDDDTTTVLMSGPAGEPYWLELDPDRAAALRDSLTSPDEAQQAGEVR
ncbi:hypothetical protein SMD44_00972 [Streptomyces alboflavus]|uniref:Uncharacterized protein n=1 Tax=Streptomyces alboflavus TaxID=67267 RepID=A0A1Z1W592_9ACTN|nr:hypothetical protein [Streptomyces alboflavus]ARX81574.1 hypothetical protein SMD44_00972 [Streptomyces alboflavus]